MKLIDISHVLDENTPVFPGDYKTSLSVCKTLEKDGYNSYLLTSCLHTGTHIDMPMHLTCDDKTAADFPPGNFFAKGVLLDVRGEKTITVKPVHEDMISAGDIVLLFTGCDKNYARPEYFTDHPVIGEDMAEFLISKKIKMLGMDTPSPDHSPFKLHKKLLESGIFILENLTNLQNLTGIAHFAVIALPLKIKAEAGFVRAVCLTQAPT